MTRERRIPAPLSPGDTIHIAAPSGRFDATRFERGCEVLTDAGFRVHYNERLLERKHRYLAGDDTDRATELAALLGDESVRAIWCARGGYGATRLLPLLDMHARNASPKWLIGFSDVTALHALWWREGVTSVHGPNVDTLGLAPEGVQGQVLSMLRGDVPSNEEPTFVGNLTVLASMAGTSFLPDLGGARVLLEDIGEKAYRLDRGVTQLFQAGFFASCREVLLGTFRDCEGFDERTPTDLLLERFAELGIPTRPGFKVGHFVDDQPMYIG